MTLSAFSWTCKLIGPASGGAGTVWSLDDCDINPFFSVSCPWLHLSKWQHLFVKMAKRVLTSCKICPQKNAQLFALTGALYAMMRYYGSGIATATLVGWFSNCCLFENRNITTQFWNNLNNFESIFKCLCGKGQPYRKGNPFWLTNSWKADFLCHRVTDMDSSSLQVFLWYLNRQGIITERDGTLAGFVHQLDLHCDFFALLFCSQHLDIKNLWRLFCAFMVIPFVCFYIGCWWGKCVNRNIMTDPLDLSLYTPICLPGDDDIIWWF